MHVNLLERNAENETEFTSLPVQKCFSRDCYRGVCTVLFEFFRSCSSAEYRIHDR